MYRNICIIVHQQNSLMNEPFMKHKCIIRWEDVRANISQIILESIYNVYTIPHEFILIIFDMKSIVYILAWTSSRVKVSHYDTICCILLYSNSLFIHCQSSPLLTHTPLTMIMCTLKSNVYGKLLTTLKFPFHTLLIWSTPHIHSSHNHNVPSKLQCLIISFLKIESH